MPVPLLWIGAGLAAIYAGSQYARHEQKNSGHVAVFPGDCKITVAPVNGSIVCCGIYELFQHTGVWLDGRIIELKGNGLVRAVSPERFIEQRSGNRIYIASDDNYQPLSDELAAQRAAQQLFSYKPYHVVKHNCHRFVWEALCGRTAPITRFAELNERLHDYFSSAIHWQPALIRSSNLA